MLEARLEQIRKSFFPEIEKISIEIRYSRLEKQSKLLNRDENGNYLIEINSRYKKGRKLNDIIKLSLVQIYLEQKKKNWDIYEWKRSFSYKARLVKVSSQYLTNGPSF